MKRDEVRAWAVVDAPLPVQRGAERPVAAGRAAARQLSCGIAIPCPTDSSTVAIVATSSLAGDSRATTCRR